MNRKWKIIIGLLIVSFIFPLGASGVSYYFTFYLPLEFGIIKNSSMKTMDSPDVELPSTIDHSTSGEATKKETATTNSPVEVISSSSVLPISGEKGLEKQQTQDSEIESEY